MKPIMENWRKFLKEGEGSFDSKVHQLYIPRACPGKTSEGGCSLPTFLKGDTSAIQNSPIGKPRGGLWTSTAISIPNKEGQEVLYSSDWNEWVKREMPEWISKDGKGILLKPKSSVKVFHIASDDDLDALKKNFTSDDPMALAMGGMFPGGLIDWEKVFEVYDGVHFGRPDGKQSESYDPGGWDAESTVWKSKEAFEEIEKVKVDVDTGYDEG